MPRPLTRLLTWRFRRLTGWIAKPGAPCSSSEATRIHPRRSPRSYMAIASCWKSNADIATIPRWSIWPKSSGLETNPSTRSGRRSIASRASPSTGRNADRTSSDFVFGKVTIHPLRPLPNAHNGDRNDAKSQHVSRGYGLVLSLEKGQIPATNLAPITSKPIKGRRRK